MTEHPAQNGSDTKKPRVVCIGAGPAGLTAARHLAKSGAEVTVLERDPVHVGGISRTEQYKGFRFDVDDGGYGRGVHRLC